MKTSFPPRRILTAVDLSSPSIAAVSMAKLLARRFHAKLEALTVQTAPESLLGLAPEAEPYSTEELARQLEDFRAWREDRVRRLLNGSGRGAAVRTVRGWASRALCDAAVSDQADLLVMGTHGYEGMSRVSFGSVAETVVGRARIPVLVVRAAPRPALPRRILIPFNFAPYAEAALAYALRFAAGLKARVGVLYVCGKGEWPLDAESKLRRRLAGLLGPAAKRLKIVVRYGDPREEILLEAREGKWDAIALSAHRRPFSRDLILGSTAERVLRHSAVPVLAVPSDAPLRSPRPKAR